VFAWAATTSAVCEIWKAWVDDLRGTPIASGHHMAEEAPDALAAELLTFLDESH
jgi:haloacetate dehalogenase